LINTILQISFGITQKHNRACDVQSLCLGLVLKNNAEKASI